jgi:FAD/FMN-containing dehydrogenase
MIHKAVPKESPLTVAKEAEDDLSPQIAALRAEIDGVPVIDEPLLVRRRSRDFFWYSPILNEQLSGKSAEIVVVPRDEDDVIRIARACVRHGLPLTPRGGGTGN